MPATYNLLADKKLVYSRLFGPVKAEDLFEHVDAMQRFFDAGTLTEKWRQVISVEEMGYIGTSLPVVIRELGKRNPWPPACRRAIVAPQKYIFELSRIYQQLVDPETKSVVVVTSLKDASEYLNHSFD